MPSHLASAGSVLEAWEEPEAEGSLPGWVWEAVEAQALEREDWTGLSPFLPYARGPRSRKG